MAVLPTAPSEEGAANAAVVPAGAAPAYSMSCPAVSTAYSSGRPSGPPAGLLRSPGDITVGYFTDQRTGLSAVGGLADQPAAALVVQFWAAVPLQV